MTVRRVGGGARASAAAPAGQRGQATVEFALVLPVLIVCVLAVVQFGFVARDEVLTVHAAREAARRAAVGGTAGEIHAAAVSGSGLPAGRVAVTRSVAGDQVTVTVTYRQPISIPLIGTGLGVVTHRRSVTMLYEPAVLE